MDFLLDKLESRQDYLLLNIAIIKKISNPSTPDKLVVGFITLRESIEKMLAELQEETIQIQHSEDTLQIPRRSLRPSQALET